MAKKSTKQGRDGGFLPVKEAAPILKCTERMLRNYVKMGMPHKKPKGKKRGALIDIEKARQWMVIQGNSGQASSQIKTEVHRTGFDSNEFLGMGGAVDRMQIAEKAAFKDYENAVKNNAPIDEQRALLRMYSETLKHLQTGTKQVEERKELFEMVWAECRSRIAEWAQPLRSFLDAAPRALALRLNPTDPAHAENILRDWLNNQLLPMMVKGSNGPKSGN